MAKQRRSEQDSAALFVRIPVEEADKLHQVALRLKASKREVIRHLLADLDPERDDILWHRPAPSPPVPLTAPLGGAELVVDRAEGPAQPAEVLDAAAVAELLSTDEAAVVELAEAGELPGRRVGGEWRFLRRAVLAWLGGASE